jgi:hypothetical protein
MPLLEVDVSKKQRPRLRNGHSVRVKQGKGVCLIVDPTHFNTTTRAFGRRKGAQIKLNPQEILANYKKLDLPNNEPVQMEGEGLFDDLKNVAKKEVKKKVRQGVNILKENAAEIAGTTLGSAAAARSRRHFKEGRVAVRTAGSTTVTLFTPAPVWHRSKNHRIEVFRRKN